MGLFSFLNASKKGMDMADTGLKGLIGGIDKVFYTDEEKADAARAGFKLQLKFLEMNKGENSVRSKTRRILAVGIIGNFLLQSNIAIGCILGDLPYVDKVLEIMKMQAGLVLAVSSFYFGYYAVKNVVEAWKGKK